MPLGQDRSGVDSGYDRKLCLRCQQRKQQHQRLHSHAGLGQADRGCRTPFASGGLLPIAMVNVRRNTSPSSIPARTAPGETAMCRCSSSTPPQMESWTRSRLPPPGLIPTNPSVIVASSLKCLSETCKQSRLCFHRCLSRCSAECNRRGLHSQGTQPCALAIWNLLAACC